MSGQSRDLFALAQAFLLPWSVYLRVLSAKNPQARATPKAFDRLQADIAAPRTKHTATTNAALLPATLERVFSEPV